MAINDVTPLAQEVHRLVSRGELDAAAGLLPQERPYSAGDELLAALRPPLLDAARPYETAAVDEVRTRAKELAAARPTTIAA